MCQRDHNSSRRVRPAAALLKVTGHAVALPFRVVMMPVSFAARTVFGQSVPFSNRRHIIFVPEWAERALGESGFRQFKANAAGKPGTAGVMLRRPGDEALVEDVARDILKALATSRPKKGTYMGHIDPDSWEFIVLDDAEANACALPGGKVVVNTGFLDFIGRDRDKLAIVLGHEIAHVVARHSVERMGTQLLIGAVGFLLVAWIRHMRQRKRAERREALMKELEEMQAALAQDYRLRGDAVFRKRYEQLEAELQRLNRDVVTRDDSQGDQMMSKMFQGAAQVLVQLPGSRRNEVEADLVGVRLAKLGGYNVHKASSLWDQFAAAHGGGGSVMSTHPSSNARSKILAEEVSLLQQHQWSEQAMQSVFHKVGYWSV